MVMNIVMNTISANSANKFVTGRVSNSLLPHSLLVSHLDDIGWGFSLFLSYLSFLCMIVPPKIRIFPSFTLLQDIIVIPSFRELLLIVIIPISAVTIILILTIIAVLHFYSHR